MRHCASAQFFKVLLFKSLLPRQASSEQTVADEDSGLPATQSSIGGSFATLPTQGGAMLNHPGLIDVI
jgi:hypothetical protein